MSLMRVAALEATYELVGHLARYSELTPAEAIEQLKNGPSDLARLDYAGALQLIELCGGPMFAPSNRTPEGHRAIITQLVATETPGWRLAAARGKKWCRDAMDMKTDQAIAWAGLWGTDDAALDWWLQLASFVRGLSETARIAVGRIGERLSFEYEQARLAALGAPCEPIWRSLDDDTLGYDIESWTYSPGSTPIPFRIEVKAYSGSERRFYLSRGEWRTALRFRPQYAVDVWDITSKTLTRFEVDEVKKAIPADVPPSEWQKLSVWPDKLKDSLGHVGDE